MVSVRETELKTLDLNATIWVYSCPSWSSWYRLYGEFSFCQEPVQEIIETVVSSDSEADH